MKRIVYLVAWIVLFIWLAILSIAFFNYRTHTLNQLSALTSASPNNPSAEVVALRAQVQQISDYNDDFLSTIHWSLLFASAFLLTFLGLVGYLTNRRYEQDKESLRTILSSQLSEAQAQLDAKVEGFKNTLHTEQETGINKLRESLNEEVRELRNSLEQIANSTVENKISALKARMGMIDRTLRNLERKLLEAEAKTYEEKKVYANALSAYFEIAKIGAEIEWAWVISDALKDIERVLEKGGKFNPDEIREVSQFLKGLPSEYEALIKGVQSKL